MTQRERLLTALERGLPDQVPVTWELVDRFAYALTGRTGWRAMCDAHRMIGSAIFNLQGVGPGLRISWGDGYGTESRTIEEGPDWRVTEQVLRTPKGTLTARVKVGGVPGDPLLPKRTEYLIKCRNDYEILADFTAEAARRAEIDNPEALAAQDYVGDDGLVGFWMADSLYHLSHGRDSQEFILDLMDVPHLIEETTRHIHPHTERCLQSFNESVADVLVYDICWGSTSMISPALFERFVLPELRWACANVAKGKKLVVFTSGRTRAVVPQIVEAGPAGVQHFDATGDCDLAEIKRTFGDRICIIGNYRPVVLAHGTVEDAIAETRRCLDDAMSGGGYIMSTSDEVPADAKLENMRAVVETVARVGIYS